MLVAPLDSLAGQSLPEKDTPDNKALKDIRDIMNQGQLPSSLKSLSSLLSLSSTARPRRPSPRSRSEHLSAAPGRLSLMMDLDVAACHGQRAIDRAPALEPRDKLRGLGWIRTTEPKRDLGGRENRHVRPRLPLTVDAAAHRDRHVLERDLRVPCEHLEDFAPQAATAVRKSSPGVGASPGQPF